MKSETSAFNTTDNCAAASASETKTRQVHVAQQEEWHEILLATAVNQRPRS